MIRSCSLGLRLLVGLAPMLAATAAFGQAGEEQEAAFDRTPRDCVIVSRIDQTEAIDDQNILFHMDGKQVFRNTLPRKCPGLERENRIAYQTGSSRLCKIDTITVLEDLGGLRPGFTCRLGEFVPLSPEEVEELEFLEEEGHAGRRAIETTSVETDDADAEPEDPAESDAAPDEPAAAEPPDDEG